MRTSVHDLLDGMTAEELDNLTELPDTGLSGEETERIAILAMEKAGITDREQDGSAFGDALPVSDDADSPITGRATKQFARRVLLVAACLILIAVTLAGCYLADMVEYNRAVGFFDLNNLSVEGLDRGEVKRVYRDITTERFDYDKSMEVLAQNTEITSVDGANIQINNYMNNNWSANTVKEIPLFQSIPDEGVYYACDTDYPEGDNWVENEKHLISSLMKYIDGDLQWRAKFNEGFFAEKNLPLNGAVLVYGMVTLNYNPYAYSGYFALVDDADGAVLWEKQLDSHHHDASIDAVLPEGDGAVLFSVASDTWDSADRHLVVQKIDRDGEVISEKDIKIDELMYVGEAAVLPDGYLVEANIGTAFTNENTRLLRLSKDGDILRELNYGSDDFTYEISDIMEHDGRIFISAKARPVDSKLYENTGDYDEETIEFGTYTEEWRDRAREEFSAVLFVLDADSGEPGQFWSVQGALAGELGTDENDNLTWQANRIIACGYSPYTNSFSIYGYTREYDYTFDRGANTLHQRRTDIIDGFRDH